MATAGNIVDDILTRLDEDPAQPARYTRDQAYAALNEGQRLFGLLTLCVERVLPLELPPNTVWHHMLSYAPDWIAPLRAVCLTSASTLDTGLWDRAMWDTLAWDDAHEPAPAGRYPVRCCQLRDLDARSRTWQLARDPRVLHYGMAGADLAFFHPVPAAAGTVVAYTYAALPRDVAWDWEVPEIPAANHQDLMDFGVYVLPINAGGSEFAQGLHLLNDFLDSAAKCAEYVRARSKSLGYDTLPFELAKFDRSRLIGQVQRKAATK